MCCSCGGIRFSPRQRARRPQPGPVPIPGRHTQSLALTGPEKGRSPHWHCEHRVNTAEHVSPQCSSVMPWREAGTNGQWERECPRSKWMQQGWPLHLLPLRRLWVSYRLKWGEVQDIHKSLGKAQTSKGTASNTCGVILSCAPGQAI